MTAVGTGTAGVLGVLGIVWAVRRENTPVVPTGVLMGIGRPALGGGDTHAIEWCERGCGRIGTVPIVTTSGPFLLCEECGPTVSVRPEPVAPQQEVLS